MQAQEFMYVSHCCPSLCFLRGSLHHTTWHGGKEPAWFLLVACSEWHSSTSFPADSPQALHHVHSRQEHAHDHGPARNNTRGA
jgi:hypothetical protein